jgi:hypothetical protein
MDDLFLNPCHSDGIPWGEDSPYVFKRAGYTEDHGVRE